ncbi:MAG: SUMF1/EgtB/PvdO family nonheme iron enzyme [Myxococcota bacterium]
MPAERESPPTVGRPRAPRSVAGGVPVSDICDNLKIDAGAYDDWQRRLLDGLFGRDRDASSDADAPSDPFDAPTRNDGGPPPVAGLLRTRHTTRFPRPPTGGPPLPADPVVGTLIGAYVINDSLGEGGMGRVFRAFDRRLNRQVALKVLHHDLGASEQQRLVREAQAMAQLAHPNVVQVYEVGHHEDRAFVVMEMVEGQTLSAWQRQQPRPDWRACVQAYLQAGAGLASAHEQGLVHRDFKPSNALIDERGRVRVMDFGLVGTMSDMDDSAEMTANDQVLRSRSGSAESLDWVSERLTQTGTVMGTPAYMAPEQIFGEDVGARGDQFSFCVSLYEAVCGHRPFPGDDLYTLAGAIRDGTITPMASQLGVPGRLEAAIARGLSFDANERWPSMEALLAELRRLVTPPRVRRWVAGVGLGIAVVAGSVALGLGVQVSEQGEQLTEKEAQLAEKVVELSEQLAAQKGLRAKDAAREGGREIEAIRLGVQAFEGLDPQAHLATAMFEGLTYALAGMDRGIPLRGHTARVYAVATSPDGERIATGSQDHTVRLWSAHTGAPMQTLEGHAMTVRSVAFSSDGGRLATGSDDRTARLWDATTGDEIESLRHGAAVTSVALAPDGTRLATTSGDSVWLWTLDDDAVVVPLLGHTARVRSVAWSPDGERLYTGSDDHTVRIWDVAMRTTIKTLHGHTDDVLDVAVTDDGSHIATGSRDETARVWDARTGTQVVVLEPAQVVHAVEFSPDGSSLATGTFDDGTARLWDIDTGRTSTVVHHDDAVVDVTFSPSGDRLLTGGWDGTARSWDLQSSAALVALPHPRRVDAVAFSPDGTRLATGSGDGSTRLWDAGSGAPIMTLEGHRIDVTTVAWSPDGGALATASWDGSVRLWDARSGAHEGTLPGHREPVRMVGWSQDGRRVLTAGRDGTARVWNARTTFEEHAVEHGAALFGAVFSPSERGILTVGANEQVYGWNLKTEQRRADLDIEGSSTALVYSPDGMRIAIASRDGSVSLRDAESGRQRVSLEGHTDAVTTMAFSADGTRLATGSEDGTARVWDADTGQRQSVFPHQGAVTSVSLSPDGRRLATASGDRRARIWTLDPSPWLAWGCAVLERRDGHDESSETACSGAIGSLGAAPGSARSHTEFGTPEISTAPDLETQPSVTVHGVELVLIPGGTFTMGSPADERDRHGNEGPPHEVTLDSFYLAKTELTNGQYARYLEANPDAYRPLSWNNERIGHEDQPVTGLSWHDAKAYCDWAGLVMPTEAQWEYAARAGTTTAYWFGDDPEDLARFGWYEGNTGARERGFSQTRSHAVATKGSNPWGLFDVHGNAFEWTQDAFTSYATDVRPGDGLRKPTGDEHSVLRGGGWGYTSSAARAAYRDRSPPSYRAATLSLRPALPVRDLGRSADEIPSRRQSAPALGMVGSAPEKSH